MVQPSKLLKHLGVVWLMLEDPRVRVPCCLVLEFGQHEPLSHEPIDLHLYLARTHDQVGTIYRGLSTDEVDC